MKTSNDVVAKLVEERMGVWRNVRRAEPALQLRRVMRSKDLKNVDIAERLGTTEANVSRWLRGNQNLTIDTLYALADSVEESLTIVFGRMSDEQVSDQDWNVGSLEKNSVRCIGDYSAENVCSFAEHKKLRDLKVVESTKRRDEYARVAISR
jgi:transcriptional regulator with XRE-family HTH domain